MATVDSLMAEARLALPRSDTPALDAELLLGVVLKKPRSWLLARGDSQVDANIRSSFRDLLQKRAAGYPIAYLIGTKEFYGLQFSVDENVLIPRPDSELLVDLALDRLKENDEMLDVGTGSGCLGIAIAKHRPDTVAWLIDSSAGALRIARHNARRLGVANVKLEQADLLPGTLPDPRQCLVIANLPYLTDTQYQSNQELHYEPKMALLGGPDGFQSIARFFAMLTRRLYAPRTILLEIDPSQQDAVSKLAPAKVQWHQDLAGRCRVAELT